VGGRLASTIGTPHTGYRIQLITGGYAPVSPAGEAVALQLFFAARQTVAEQMVKQLRKTAP
jgi:hypothetical protein